MLPETSDPDELTTDVPRAARFTTSTQVSRLFLLIFLVLVASLLGWLHDRDLGGMNALKAQGRTTLAHIVSKHITQGKSTSYYLDYTFDGNGIWVDGDENVGEDEYTDTRPGEVIQITFLPSRPQTYEIGTMTQARIQARQDVWLWGEFPAFAFFGLLLIAMEATLRQHLSLLRDGSVAAGTVTDLRSPGASQGLFYVTYQFTVDGRRYSKKITCSEAYYKQSQSGQALIILYNPVRPLQSIPYRMLTDVTLSKKGKTT